MNEFKFATTTLMGLLIVFTFVAVCYAIVRGGGRNKEPEAIDIPGKEPEAMNIAEKKSEEETPNVTVFEAKDVPASEFDFRFSERPFISYEYYN
jgi:hypothetical protein